MKPAKFHYLRPETLEEALQYLADYGEEAKILAGGQSLIPIMNMRLSTPKYLIDVGRLDELNYIREANGQISVGATTRHIDVQTSSLIHDKNRLLHEAMNYVGNRQIRYRGTMGGSIAHGDPSAELPLIVSVLRGEIVVADTNGETAYKPEEFFITYLLTSLEPTQMIKEVRFPTLSPDSGVAFMEVSRRHGDFALVGVAVVIQLDDGGSVQQAYLGVGGAHPVPCVLEEIEEFLIGKQLTDSLINEASSQVADYLEPEDDLHGTAEYRKELAVELMRRTLQKAAKQAGGGAK